VTSHGASDPAAGGRDFTSKLIRNVIYPLWTRRDHPAYLRYRKLFAKTEFLPAEALESFQMEQLRKQLLHAYRSIPYYKRKMEQAGVTPLDIRSLADVKLLPVLTKRDIQEHKQEMVAEDIPEKARVRNQTGGSTGSPLQFWVDKERFDSRRASTDRHNAWTGLYPGDWCADLWGARLDLGNSVLPTVDWKQKYLHRMLPLNTSSVSEADLNGYIEILRQYRPKFMLAYAESAAMFARHCQAVGADDIRFDVVITTAEVLLPQSRAVIEEVFHANVFNRYGCRELSVIASECEYHTGMHVNADALLVEVDPQPGLPEGLGRLLVTDLFNRSMPLIRYEIGDLAAWTSAAPCPCGRHLPRLERIEGRITDFLLMPDKRKISGPSLTLVVGDMPDVRQVQFVQRGPAKITLRVVPGPGYGSDTVMELRRRLDPYLRGMAELTIVSVDEIPKESSGKYRFVKTENENSLYAVAE
jgi:phenylacetate-CoA ligase